MSNFRDLGTIYTRTVLPDRGAVTGLVGLNLLFMDRQQEMLCQNPGLALNISKA